MNIGQAAQAAGVSAKMVRHYESIGLLPPSARSDSGYRQFRAEDVEALSFIRQARELGFGMEQIRELMALRADKRRPSKKVRAVAQLHLEALNAKLDELVEMKAVLEALIARCPGNESPDCEILASLESRKGRHRSAEPSIAPSRQTSCSHGG